MSKPPHDLPVVFLAFANDHQAYLYKLTEEQDGIRSRLEQAESNGLCKVVYETDTDIDKIFKVFDKYQDRIAVFHYGGHAEDFTLLLKESSGKRQHAHSEGLMEFLGQQKGLKFVFINGCCSKQQAELLRDKGVPAVIGTSQPIDDAAATVLSTQFYESLSAGRTLNQAWKAAEAKVKTLTDASSGYRAIGSVETEEKETRISFPWELYIRSGAEDVKQWNLPRAAKNPLHNLPLPDKYYRTLPAAPFPGLHYFTRDNAAAFFGRGVQICELYNHICGVHRIILFFGQSGVGKSSLLDAGLLPRIEDKFAVLYARRVQELGLNGTLNHALEEKLNGNPIPAAETSPPEKEDVLNMLVAAVGKTSDASIQQEIQALINRLESAPAAQMQELPDILKKWQALEQQQGNPLLVILDQVEEKYTRPMPGRQKEDELIAFLMAIQPLFAAEDSGIQGKLILSYRKEYHPEIRDTFHALELPYAEVFLKRLGREGVIEAITGVNLHQATRDKYRLEIEQTPEGNLADIMTDDLLEDPESPIAPVLQIILKKLWESAPKKAGEAVNFTIADYQRLRKEGTSMGEFFRRQMEALASHHPKAVESGLALDLLHHHTTTMGTAGSCRREDLFQLYNVDNQQLAKLIQEFQDLALLNRIDTPEEGAADRDAGYTTILAHDTLAPVIIHEYNLSVKSGQRAARILSNKLGDIAFQASPASIEKLKLIGIEEKALQDLQKPVIGIDKFRMALAEALGEEHYERQETDIIQMAELNFKPEKSEIILGDADLAAVEQGALKTPGMRRLMRAEEILLANSRERRAQQQRLRKQLWAGGLAMLLLIIGAAVFAYFQMKQAEANELRTQRQLALNHWDNSQRLREENHPLESLYTTTEASKLAADNQLGANIQLGAKALYLELAPLSIMVQDTPWVRPVFNRQENRLLTWSGDSVVSLWDVYSGEEIRRLTHEGSVIGAKFSNDGNRVFTWSDVNIVWLWEAETGNEIANMTHPGKIDRVRVDENGRRLLTLSKEDTLCLWNVEGANKIASTIDGGRFRGAGFNKDGRRFLIMNESGVWLKNPDNGEKIANLQHERPLSRAIFDNDGRRIITWGRYENVKLWDSDDGGLLATMRKDQSIDKVMFNSDGSRILLLQEHSDSLQLWDGSSSGPIAKLKHEGWIRDTFINRDGDRILTWSNDKSARLWNADNGRLIAKMVHDGHIKGTVFSGDFNRILTWSSDKTARLWKANNGDPITTFSHGYDVEGAVFNGDNSRILTWNYSNVRLWDVETGTQISNMVDEKQFSGAAFVGNRNHIFTWGRGNYARLWEENESGRFSILPHEVEFPYITADGTRILTRNDIEHTVQLWKSPGDEQFGRSLSGKDAGNHGIFTSDGSRIITWSKKNAASLWNANDGSQIGAMTHEDTIKGAAFYKDDSCAITWSNQSIRLWNTADGKQLSIMKLTHPVDGVQMDKDGRRILSWKSEIAQLWSTDTGMPIATLVHEDKDAYDGQTYPDAVDAVIFSDDGSRFLTWANNNANVWDAANGKMISSFGHGGMLYDVAFSSDGSRLLLAEQGQTIWLMETAEGTIIDSLFHMGAVTGGMFSKDVSRILTFTTGGMYLWDAATRKKIATPGVVDIPFEIFRADGSQFLNTGGRGVIIWDARDGKTVLEIEYAGEIVGTAINSDYSRILTWSGDNTLQLWETDTGAQIGASMRHEGAVSGAKLSSDGHRILSWSGEDNTARLWAAGSGKEILNLKHDQPVIYAAFSKDGTAILTQRSDGIVRWWDIGLDLDFPPEKYVLQLNVLTATEFNIDSKNIETLNASQWQKAREEYLKFAKAHYKTCKYPRYNQFRRFFPEAAAKVRAFEE